MYTLCPATCRILLCSSIDPAPLCLLPSLCSALRLLTEMDTAYFLETLAGSFMDVVQYNQDNRQFEVGTALAPGTHNPFDKTKKIILTIIFQLTD